MNRHLVPVVLSGLLIGCATHAVLKADGVVSAGLDKPDVTVTADTDVIRRSPAGLEPTMDIQLNPGLAASFEHALEKYVDSAIVRIVTADLAVTTRLNRQHVTLTMLVEANGETYQLRHDKDTNDAGFSGSRYLQELPEYLDSCAVQLAQKRTTDRG